MSWPLSEAKNRFSEVFELALREGPQEVTRRGKERVFVMSERDMTRLKGKRPSFKKFLLNGPSLEGLDLARDRGPDREVIL